MYICCFSYLVRKSVWLSLIKKNEERKKQRNKKSKMHIRKASKRGQNDRKKGKNEITATILQRMNDEGKEDNQNTDQMR